ncbi:MAG: LysE family translocator [Candidatus Methanomethylophilaceae archaeon]|nr:LysE family translocator [Candidatus Methanomethylophilaceae archaeon]
MDALAFLIMVFLISFTGALSPGPLTFGAMVKGVEDPWAGIKVSLGHSLMEVPLIVAIYLGVMAIVNDQLLTAIGLLGGSILVFMGIQMVRSRSDMGSQGEDKMRSSGTVGFLASIGNPYTWIWWLTVGAALIAQAVGFGIWMLPLFIVAHLSTDFVWITLVAFSTNKSRALLSEGWMSRIVAGGGLLLMAFGAYFLLTSLSGISL